MGRPSETALAFDPVDGATYKLIYLAKRRPDMPADDFPAAWRAHSRLASSFATSLGRHFLSSRQCVKDEIAGADPVFSCRYDGSSILTMRSWPDLMAARYHPHALDELLEDEKRVFAGQVDDWTMAVEETVIRAGETRDHVLLSFLTPDAGADPADFMRRSADGTQSLADTLGHVSRVVWNRVVDPASAYPFTAVTELWFETRDALASAVGASRIADALAPRGVGDRARSVHLTARLNGAKTMVDVNGATAWSESG